MNLIKTERDFERLECKPYGISNPTYAHWCLVQQSSAIGNYDDSMEKPGSSYLWVGNSHHLNREQVQELVEHLQAWLNTGSLSLEKEK